MASDTEYTSDVDEAYRTKISGDHLEYLKGKIVQYITCSDRISADIHRASGQPAKLVLSIGSKTCQSSDLSQPTKKSNKLLVRNLPETADEEFLEMFFEHTKRQGGGPVKDVYLNKDDRFAVIEFEEAGAVDAVLNKQPIVMQGTPVYVEMLTSYLETGESLKSVEIFGIEDYLAKDLAKVKLEQKNSTPLVPRFLSLYDMMGTFCNNCGCNLTEQATLVIFKCRTCSDFNLCWYCHYTTKHDPSHIFISIEPGNNLMKSVHTFIECDICGQCPIIGARYMCTNCNQFDLCSTCKSSKKHNSKHVLVTIV